ncbi:winged helix-turn-helix domain-containing protein [Granulicella sibirica]|uniref:Signal transduction response regulator n=1 Tax=Granulicella sibirica TaxID=2479048 RepID=A0A4Q0SZG3_9BACT|nr:transcriptional regulator [Granulicella sibirica]RXH56277.1 Signal transduction response regulator [Granulicella sibirica]
MVYFFAEFQVDDAEFHFSVEGERIQLEPKVLRLLIYFIENANRLVRKQELLDALWPSTMVTENALTRVIGLLRKALGDDSQNPRFLHTIPTAGYRFVADIHTEPERRVAPSLPPDAGDSAVILPAPPTHGDAALPSTAGSRRWSFVAAAVFVFAVALLLISRMTRHLPQPASSSPTRAEAYPAPITPTASDRIHLATAQARNPVAYEAYERATFLIFNEVSHGDDVNYSEASRELETAIRLDPQFAEPYAMLAQVLQRYVHHGTGDVRAEYARSYLLANKALALNPQSSLAHDVLGELHSDKEGDFRWEAAVGELKMALTLNPDDALAHGLLGAIYVKVGLLDHAIEQADIAHHLDPSFNIYTGEKIRALEYQQHFLEASDLCVTLAHKAACAIYLWESGQRDEAWTALQAGLQNPEMRASLGYDLMTSEAFLLAHKGESAEAEKVIQSILKSVNLKSDTFFAFSEYRLGEAYAAMGEETKAIDLLEASSLNGFPCYPWYANDPELAQLRANPRFIALIERLRRQYEVFQKTL